MTDTSEILALADSDPATFILRAADLREQRAKAATQGRWRWRDVGGRSGKMSLIAEVRDAQVGYLTIVPSGSPDVYPSKYDAEHIAAEANPAHALAAVRRWRGVVERHGTPVTVYGEAWCGDHRKAWRLGKCPEIAETADEARAYLGGAS